MIQKPLLLLTLVASILAVRGQGTLSFSAHLTGNIDYTGDGTFSLRQTNNLLIYNVLVDYGYNRMQIRGPWPETNAPVIFELPLSGSQPPDPLPSTNRGFSAFIGSFYLSDTQASDLKSGLWYLYTPPGGPYALQGQIVPVPEPTTVVLAVIGLLVLLFLRSRKPPELSIPERNLEKTRKPRFDRHCTPTPRSPCCSGP